LTAQGANIPPQILLELAPLQASVKRKLLALLEKKDPVAEQAKAIALQSEGAKVEETKSKVALNLASAQEKAQGGAHGIVERQMDAQAKGQEHQMKMTELVAKTQSERERGQIKAAGEFHKLQAGREKSAMDIQVNALKSAQQLRQKEEQHRMNLRNKPAKGGNK
jgi:hypothetical protein